jgi:hypothetical protein
MQPAGFVMLAQEASDMPPIVRSIFAVIFGFMVMILSKIFLTLIFLRIMGPRPDQTSAEYLALNLVFTLLAATIGGAVAALVAVKRPIAHAVPLACIVLILGLLPYRHYTGLQPFWYQVMMMIAPPLCAVAGAALYARNAPAISR